MTSAGAAYHRFQRALATENLLLVRAAAAELPSLTLADQLRVLLVMRDRERATYDRAAARWLANLVHAAPEMVIAEAQVVAAGLVALGAGHDAAGGAGIGVVAGRHGVRDVERVLAGVSRGELRSPG
jgi:hypothetical protein